MGNRAQQPESAASAAAARAAADQLRDRAHEKVMGREAAASARVAAEVGEADPGPSVVAQVRAALRLTAAAFARLVGASVRAVADWEKGADLSPLARRRVLEVQRFQQRLSRVVRPDAIPGWLDAPNPAFGGLKPLEVIERGEIDRLWDMIFYIESGTAT